MPEWVIIVCGVLTLSMIIFSFKVTKTDIAGLGYFLPILFTVIFFTYELFYDGSTLLGKVFLRYIFLSFIAVVFIFRLHAMYMERKLKLPVWIAKLLQATRIFERRKHER